MARLSVTPTGSSAGGPVRKASSPLADVRGRERGLVLLKSLGIAKIEKVWRITSAGDAGELGDVFLCSTVSEPKTEADLFEVVADTRQVIEVRKTWSSAI